MRLINKKDKKPHNNLLNKQYKYMEISMNMTLVIILIHTLKSKLCVKFMEYLDRHPLIIYQGLGVYSVDIPSLNKKTQTHYNNSLNKQYKYTEIDMNMMIAIMLMHLPRFKYNVKFMEYLNKHPLII